MYILLIIIINKLCIQLCMYMIVHITAYNMYVYICTAAQAGHKDILYKNYAIYIYIDLDL